MSWNLRVTLVCACLALTGTLALAAVPVVVYPNPIQFGIVPQHSTGSPVLVFLDNTSTAAVTITSTTITGTSSSNFAFDGYSCVGTISVGQSCQMYMSFTPSAIGNVAASLAIVEAGVTTAITIPLQGTGGNPIPTITTLAPPTVYVNSPSTTITINGSGFLPSSAVFQQNTNTQLPSTFVSATQIKAQIPDTFLASTGSIGLSVTNPQPGGGSAFTTLQIISTDPSIQNTTPTSIVAGTPSEPILVNGQNFAAGAKVQWNGTSIPTTYLSSSQLQAQPSTAELASAGLIQLTVTNPSPGTISAAVPFDVTYSVNVTVLDLPANDLVWDPFAQLIYASLPSSNGTNGNSIAVINPSSGAVTGYFFAGSEPTKLALDSTSKYLYVGLNGSGSVQRLILPGFTPDIRINLGTQNGPNLAGAIAVSPSNSHMSAIAITQNECCGSSPLEFFTDATKLANSVSSQNFSQLAFATGTTLYGYVSNALSQITVSATGGTLAQTWVGLVTGNTFQYSGGLIFGGNGQEFNPATGVLLGTFDVVGNTCCNTSTQVLANSSLNRAFALGQTPFFPSLGITSYNLTQFTPLAVASLEELEPNFNSASTSKFIQWGANGLAFILNSGCCGSPTTQVVLLQSPSLLLTASKVVNPVPVLKSSSPTAASHGAGNFRLILRGSGFVPGSVVTWNGKTRSASYVSGVEMVVYMTKAAIASAGTAKIVVRNPTPGGGTSNALAFTIN